VQAHKNSQATQRRRLSILIADDNADTVLTLSTLLRDEGHIVHTCIRSTTVLEAVKRYEPDVCIFDIVMPEKSGFTLAREVRELSLPKQPILIAITAVYTRPNEKLMARAIGFAHFIVKPADPSELLALLETIGDDGPQAA
jgi:DNA-binding response OmpR family regulator